MRRLLVRSVQIEHHRAVADDQSRQNGPAVSALTVLETALYADDLESAAQFYEQVLGLPAILRETGRHVFFRAGPTLVLVFNPTSTAKMPTFVGGCAIPLHGSRGPGHVAFAVPEVELAAWQARLARAGIVIEADVVWPSGGRSIYVRDPAGNSVELATRRVWHGHLAADEK